MNVSHESSTPTPTTAADPTPANSKGWVPIRTLLLRHRDRLKAHLLQLDERSRYLRFGYVASDAQLAQYVDHIDFTQDEVFGIFNRRLELIATAHLAHRPAMQSDKQRRMAEFGVSVLHSARRRGYGHRLFEHAMQHARNRDVDTLFIHALSENVAMLKIARKAGATVERDGSESQAWLRLPAGSLASHLGEMISQRVAEVDYRLKLHAHLGDTLLSTPADTVPRDGA